VTLSDLTVGDVGAIIAAALAVGGIVYQVRDGEKRHRELAKETREKLAEHDGSIAALTYWRAGIDVKLDNMRDEQVRHATVLHENRGAE
jgi:hypothetical protein